MSKEKVKGIRIKVVTEDDVVHGKEFATIAELLDWLDEELGVDCAPRRGKMKPLEEKTL